MRHALRLSPRRKQVIDLLECEVVQFRSHDGPIWIHRKDSLLRLEPRRNALDVELAAEVLRLNPWTHLVDGLSETVAYLRGVGGTEA
jgi:hypothetical protein